MINRTLIRLKVVQMLYAHLLTRTDFKIYREPARKTIESRQSFEIYCRVLSLLLVLTNQNGVPGALAELREANSRKALMRNDKMLMALASDPDLKETIQKTIEHGADLQHILDRFQTGVEESAIYKDYSKKRRIDIDDNIRFWETIIKTVLEPILLSDTTVTEEYSSKAIANGCEMAIETLRNYAGVRITLIEAEQALKASLDKAYELYVGLLVLAVEITKLRREQIEAAKNKYLPTAEELNPNTRFIDNLFIKSLEENEDLRNYLKKKPLTWDNDPMFIKNLLGDILASEPYIHYMELPAASYADDCELWRKLFQDVIFPSDALAEEMENRNVYWNDDLHIMGTFVIKSIRRAAKSTNPDAPFQLLPMYKDEEDSKFGAELFSKAVEHHEEYRAYIDRFIKESWDPERIAFMDVVIMITAIAELINFPNIPLPVTMNEYTDIAADYSTARSGQFVNGLLFAVAEELKRQGRIFK